MAIDRPGKNRGGASGVPREMRSAPPIPPTGMVLQALTWVGAR